VAAGLAARLGFTLDQIEDLKIAVDELTAYLTGPQGRPGTLELRFVVGDHHLEIGGQGRFGSEQEVRTELTDMSRMILETVVDSATLDATDGVPTFSLVKSR
jgi:serine/threonine-protein kinase RsbW